MINKNNEINLCLAAGVGWDIIIIESHNRRTKINLTRFWVDLHRRCNSTIIKIIVAYLFVRKIELLCNIRLRVKVNCL